MTSEIIRGLVMQPSSSLKKEEEPEVQPPVNVLPLQPKQKPPQPVTAPLATASTPVHPLTQRALQNWDLTADMDANELAINRILARKLNMPLGVIQKAHPSMRKRMMERQDVQKALQLESVTRRKLAENAEIAGILRGDVDKTLASENAVKRMARGVSGQPSAEEAAWDEVFRKDDQETSLVGGTITGAARGTLRAKAGILVAWAEQLAEIADAQGKSFVDVYMENVYEDAFELPATDPLDDKKKRILTLSDFITAIPSTIIEKVFAPDTAEEQDVLRAKSSGAFTAAFETMRRSEAIPRSEQSKRFLAKVHTLKGSFLSQTAQFVGLIVNDPVGFMATSNEVMAEQIPVLGAGAVTSRFFGAGAGIAVSTGGNYAQERFMLTPDRIKYVKEATNVDLSTKEGLKKYMTDPSVREAFIDYGVGRGVPIAVAQLASLGLMRYIWKGGLSRTAKFGSSTAANMVLEGAGEAGAMTFSGGDFVFSEVLLEAFAGAHPVMVGAEAYTSIAGDVQDRADAKKAKEWLKGATELRESMSTLEEEKRDAAVEVVSERFLEEGVDEVAIDAEQLLLFDDKADIDVLDTLGIDRADVTEAANEGSSVEVSVDTFVRHIIGQDGFEALWEHTRPAGRPATDVEAVEYEEQGIEQKMRELEQRALDRIGPNLDPKTAAKLSEDVEVIRETVAQQLIELGRSSDEAELAAQLTAKKFATRAIRLTEETGQPVDALALFEADNLRIEGEQARVEAPTFEQVDRIKLSYKDVTERTPALNEAARRRRAGEITAEEYAKEVDKLKTVLPFEAVPEPATTEEMRGALDKRKKEKLGKADQIPVGQRVGLRLDIPAYRDHGVWVPTIHNTPVGNVHEAAVRITNVDLMPTEGEQQKAAQAFDDPDRTKKSPFARMDGDFQSADVEALTARAQEVINDPEWTQVGYDPERHSFFYDRSDQRPIVSADEVIQVGPLVLAKNVQYGDAETFLFQDGALTTPDSEIKGSVEGEADDKRWRVLKPKKTKGGKFLGTPEWVKTARDLGKLRTLLRKLTKEGNPGRYWYEDSALEALRITNGDYVQAEKFIGLLAIYSPQTGVFPNTGFAIKAYTQWKNGEKVNVKTDIQDEKATAWLEQGKDWGGRKVNSFYLNLMKELLTSADAVTLEKLALPDDVVSEIDAATVDLWVLRAMGYELDAAGGSEGLAGKYSFSENEIRRLAGVLNSELQQGERRWLPHQVQAALWTAIKGRYEVPTVKKKTIEESVKKGYSKYDDETGKWTAPPQNTPNKVEHMKIWRKHALAALDEDVQKSVETAKGSFGTMLNRIAQNITWEAVPSEDLNHDITSADLEVRQQFTEEAIGLIVDDTGHDLLADQVGVPLNLAELGTGGYAGDINTNAITTLIPVKPAGVFDNQTALDYARAIQYIFKQDAVPVFRAESKLDVSKDYSVRNSKGKSVKSFPTQAEAEAEIVARREKLEASTKKDGTLKSGVQEKLDDLDNWSVQGGSLARGLRISFKAPLDQQSEEVFYQRLRKHLGKDAGYSKINGEIVVINFRDDTTGLPFMNDEAFLDGIEAMEKEDGETLNISKTEKFGSEGQYGPVHDWSAEPDGQVVLDTIDTSRRPDFQSWVRDRREAFEAVLKRYEGTELEARQEELALRRTAPAPAFEQTGAQDVPRGGFTPSDLITDQDGNPVNLIQIFEKADQSTFLHESGHFWLEQLKSDAAAVGGQFQRDFDIVTKWWGSRSLEIKDEAIRRAKKKKDKASVAALQKMTDAQVKAYIRQGDLRGEGANRWLSIAMHEQFARGVEDYFYKGEAPSIDLASLFTSFKVWVQSLFIRIRSMDKVSLSPEVTGVLNSMLASDEEIAMMEGQYEMTSLFDTAAEGGFTAEQFAANNKSIDRAKRESKARHLAKHLREENRVKKKWWQDEKERLKEEVSLEVARSRPYRLIYGLTQQGLIDGSTLEDVEKVDRIDKKMLSVILEKEGYALSDLPKGASNKNIYMEGGAEPGVVAAAYGYNDVFEMLLELVETVPYATEVEVRSDNKMNDLHGSLETEGLPEAIASIHGDHVVRHMAVELEALRTTEPAFKPAFIRMYAKRRIQEVTLSNAKPHKFLAEERRHAKAAKRAIKAGDKVAAYQHQFQRLVNHRLAEEAIRAQKMITRESAYLRELKRKGRKFRSVEAAYVDKILALVNVVDFSAPLTDKARLHAELLAINKFIAERAENDGAILEMPAWVTDKDKLENVNNMTYAEFLELSRTVRSFEKQGKLAKSLIVGKENRDRAATKAKMIAALDGRNKSTVSDILRKNAGTHPPMSDVFEGSLDPVRSQGGAVLAQLDAQMLKIEFLLEALDGEPLGIWQQTLFQPFQDAENAKNTLMKEVLDVVAEKISSLPRRGLSKGMGKRVDVGQDKGGLGFPGLTVRRSHLIMLALNSGNASNLDKLIRGMGGNKEAGIKGQGWNISEELLDEALQQLTKEEWDLVKAVWAQAEKLWPMVERVYRNENGVAPERVEPRTIDTPFGPVTGGYFPMIYNHQAPSDIATDKIAEMSALEMMQEQIGKVSVNSSMTKARTGFAAAVDLNLENLTRGLDASIHYITHYEAVRNAAKILGDGQIKGALDDKIGVAYTRILKQWLSAVSANNGERPPMGIMDHVIGRIASNTTATMLGFSYTTLFAQTLGLTSAIDRFAADTTYGPISLLEIKKDLVHAIGLTMIGAHRDIIVGNEANGTPPLSTFMQFRRDNVDRDIQQAQKNLRGAKDPLAITARLGMSAIANAQFWSVDLPVWIAAYNRALRAEPQDTQKAVNYADRVVRLTQSSGSIKDLSAVMRNNKGLWKTVTMFMTWFSALYAMLREVGVEFKDDVRSKPGRATMRVASRVFTLLVLQSIGMGLIRGELPDWEPEDEDDESMAGWLAKDVAKTAVGGIPIVRDLINGLTTDYGYSGSPLAQVATSIIQIGEDGLEMAEGWFDDGLDFEMEKSWEETMTALRPYILLGGTLTGLPAIQVNRTLKGLAALWDDEMNFQWGDIIRGRTKKQLELRDPLGD